MVCKAIDMCEMQVGRLKPSRFMRRAQSHPEVRSVWAWGWARYTQIDLPLLPLGPTLRINDLKFPPTHSHDLGNNLPYVIHTM